MNPALTRVRPNQLPRAVAWTRRSLASQAPGSPVFEVFNRRSKWLQKERAAADVEGSRQADYLKDEVAVRLCERLLVGSTRHPMTCSYRPSALWLTPPSRAAGHQATLPARPRPGRQHLQRRTRPHPREPGPGPGEAHLPAARGPHHRAGRCRLVARAAVSRRGPAL